MEIIENRNGDVLTLSLNGKISAATAEKFNAAIESAITGTDKLVLDFQGVNYLASAGLRVLVSTQKQLKTRFGSLRLINVNETVRETFEVTGLDDLLDIAP
jgi:anti-sigma B factor antagonist